MTVETHLTRYSLRTSVRPMTVEDVYDSDRVAEQALSRAVRTLVLARAVNRVGAFTLSFLSVLLVDDLGATLPQAGWVVTAFGLATIPSRLLGGRLADRWGRVPTIVLGLVGCAAAQLWIAASATLTSALLGAIGLGLVFELYEPPSQALVADLTTEAQRPRAYGLLTAALAVAGAVAGLLALAIGTLDLRWLLVTDAVTCLGAAVLVLLLVHEPASGPTSRPSETSSEDDGRRTTPVSAWRDRRLLAMLAAGTLFALAYMCVILGLPLTLAARGLPPEHAGVVLTVSAVTMVAAQPLLRLRVLHGSGGGGDGFRALTIGYVVLAAGLASAAVATHLAAFCAAAVVWSVGDLLLMGHAWTIVSRLAPPGSRGAYLAAYGLSWGVATVVAPLVTTGLLAHGGPGALWSAVAGLALCLAAGQPALARLCRAPVPTLPVSD